MRRVNRGPLEKLNHVQSRRIPAVVAKNVGSVFALPPCLSLSLSAPLLLDPLFHSPPVLQNDLLVRAMNAQSYFRRKEGFFSEGRWKAG